MALSRDLPAGDPPARHLGCGLEPVRRLVRSQGQVLATELLMACHLFAELGETVRFPVADLDSCVP